MDYWDMLGLCEEGKNAPDWSSLWVRICCILPFSAPVQSRVPLYSMTLINTGLMTSSRLPSFCVFNKILFSFVQYSKPISHRSFFFSPKNREQKRLSLLVKAPLCSLWYIFCKPSGLILFLFRVWCMIHLKSLTCLLFPSLCRVVFTKGLAQSWAAATRRLNKEIKAWSAYIIIVNAVRRPQQLPYIKISFKKSCQNFADSWGQEKRHTSADWRQMGHQDTQSCIW